MQSIIKSNLYNIVIEQEEQQQEEIPETELNPEIITHIKDIVNPASKDESEKINNVINLVSQKTEENNDQQLDSDDEMDEEMENEGEDNYIPIKQTELIKKLISLRMELIKNETNIENFIEFNDILYTIDSLIDNFEIFQYEDQLNLIELIIKKMNKIK